MQPKINKINKLKKKKNKQKKGNNKQQKSMKPKAGSLRKMKIIDKPLGTSLVVQWLILGGPNAGGPGSIPSQGTRSHMPQLRSCMPQLKIPHAAIKIPHATIKTLRSQINIFKNLKLKK